MPAHLLTPPPCPLAPTEANKDRIRACGGERVLRELAELDHERIASQAARAIRNLNASAAAAAGAGTAAAATDGPAAPATG